MSEHEPSLEPEDQELSDQRNEVDLVAKVDRHHPQRAYIVTSLLLFAAIFAGWYWPSVSIILAPLTVASATDPYVIIVDAQTAVTTGEQFQIKLKARGARQCKVRFFSNQTLLTSRADATSNSTSSAAWNSREASSITPLFDSSALDSARWTRRPYSSMSALYKICQSKTPVLELNKPFEFVSSVDGQAMITGQLPPGEYIYLVETDRSGSQPSESQKNEHDIEPSVRAVGVMHVTDIGFLLKEVPGQAVVKLFDLHTGLTDDKWLVFLIRNGNTPRCLELKAHEYEERAGS